MRSLTLTLLLPLLLIQPFPPSPNAPANEGDNLIGVWEPSNGRARVKVEKIGAKYYGKIVWLREPNDPVTGAPKVDKNNPDEALRSTPLRGYRILKDFVHTGKNEWSEGTIYDPENGSTYSCVITMKDDNTLDIRGYIGVKALGRTDVWKRLQTKGQ
ncbi:MAG: DUF2147 domain-containing protein [Flavobacteriales bacterium]|nr:DUF2147 domain-containing protein [Flavobacteriales bacterium]